MNLQNKNEPIKQLDDIISMLKTHSNILKRRTVVVAITTFMNIICAIIIIGFYIIGHDRYSTFLDIKYILFLFSIILMVQALIHLYLFDQKKKNGDIIFEEASDYYEWLVKRQLSSDELNYLGSDIFKLKVAFREYTRSCDLPLMPGTRGISMYTFINIIVVFIVGLSLIVMSIQY